MENTMIAEKQPLTEEYLQKMDAYWRAANYLAAAQLYLLDNPLLRRADLLPYQPEPACVRLSGGRDDYYVLRYACAE